MESSTVICMKLYRLLVDPPRKCKLPFSQTNQKANLINFRDLPASIRRHNRSQTLIVSLNVCFLSVQTLTSLCFSSRCFLCLFWAQKSSCYFLHAWRSVYLLGLACNLDCIWKAKHFNSQEIRNFLRFSPSGPREQVMNALRLEKTPKMHFSVSLFRAFFGLLERSRKTQAQQTSVIKIILNAMQFWDYLKLFTPRFRLAKVKSCLNN